MDELIGEGKIGGSLGFSDHALVEFTILRDMGQRWAALGIAPPQVLPQRWMHVRRKDPPNGDSFGDPDGTLLLNLKESVESRNLQPAPRDSRGEPLIPGLKSSEQDPWEALYTEHDLIWQEDKWDEVPYVDLFFTLRNHLEWQKQCGIIPQDSMVILDTLLDGTEKKMVLNTARKQVEGAHANGNLQGTIDQNFPATDPEWDPNQPGPRGLLTRYWRWILFGIRHTMPKLINWSKLYEIKQEPNDSLIFNTPRPKEEIPVQMEDAVTPLIWASRIPGWSKLAELVKVVLKSGTKPVRQNQYPIKWEARKGLEELIKKFLNYGLLIECESEYNTPIIPVRKQDGKEYRLVQDLRAVNQIVQDIYPVVANPYTLLTSLKGKHKWFTVLDLKDAFFCIPLDKDSQAIFAFKWERFKNSPTIFGNQLARELELWKKENLKGTILQYVDDIVLAAETQGECLQMTISLLNFLGQGGYRVSKNKAQIGKETVIYLGFEISQGQRRLGANRKEAICQTPEPKTVQELRAFWGSKENHLLWTPECQVAFKRRPKEVAVMHCKAHQFGQTAVNVGNRLADKTAKEVAEQSILALVPVKQMKLPTLKPNYGELDQQLASLLKATINEEGWLVTPTKQVIVTPQRFLHFLKYVSAEAPQTLLIGSVVGPLRSWLEPTATNTGQAAPVLLPQRLPLQLLPGPPNLATYIQYSLR
ncbi:hypothetical protein QYF61_001077, partial [Mycteria americana]